MPPPKHYSFNDYNNISRTHTDKLLLTDKELYSKMHLCPFICEYIQFRAQGKARLFSYQKQIHYVLSLNRQYFYGTV